MNWKWLSVACLSTVLVFGTVVGGYAATSLGSTTVSATVPSSIAITVPANLNLGVTIDSTATTDMAITMDTNSNWSMTVYKSGDLTFSGQTVPSAQLLYTSSISTTGTSQSTDTQFAFTPGTNVVTGGAPTGEIGSTVTVHYKLKVTDAQAPGTYTAVHTYTATTQ